MVLKSITQRLTQMFYDKRMNKKIKSDIYKYNETKPTQTWVIRELHAPKNVKSFLNNATNNNRIIDDD